MGDLCPPPVSTGRSLDRHKRQEGSRTIRKVAGKAQIGHRRPSPVTYFILIGVIFFIDHESFARFFSFCLTNSDERKMPAASAARFFSFCLTTSRVSRTTRRVCPFRLKLNYHTAEAGGICPFLARARLKLNYHTAEAGGICPFLARARLKMNYHTAEETVQELRAKAYCNSRDLRAKRV